MPVKRACLPQGLEINRRVKCAVISRIIYVLESFIGFNRLSPKRAAAAVISRNGSCPNFPIATFQCIGRLGNIISSYANFIVMDWELGLKLHLPRCAKSAMQKVFQNVTFPIYDEKCKLRFHRLDNLDPFVGDQVKCKYSRMGAGEDGSSIPCLPTNLRKILNIKVHPRHNVS